jgi:secreted trypsin-like serine protease
VATSFISFVSAGEPEPRIVGGQNADINEYPWFTAWGKSCGATLIHDDILLTAAHVSCDDRIPMARAIVIDFPERISQNYYHYFFSTISAIP